MPNPVQQPKMRRNRRTLTAVLGMLVIVAATMLTTAPAQADGLFDLYGLSSPGLHITSGSCRHVTVTAKTNAPYDASDIEAQVDLWLGSSQVDSVDLSPVNGNMDRLAGDYYFCPGLDEPGRYRLGSTEVTWYDQDYNSYSFIDDSRGTLVAKQATRAGFSGDRSGSVRTFHAHPTWFYCGWNPNSMDPNGWYWLPKGYPVTLQRRAANGTGTWRNMTTHRTDSRDRVTFQVTASKKYQYRVVSPGTAHTWATTSRALTY